MGTPYFDRRAELTVAPVSGGQGLKVSKLRIAFDTKKTNTSSPNTATIRVYNLNPASRALVSTEGQAVILKAGYLGLMSTEVVGMVDRVEHVIAPPEIVTTIYVKDGKTDLYGSTFSRSYASGTSKIQIFRDILAAMPNTQVGQLSASGLDGNISGPLVLSGRARVVADKVARAWGVEWSVQEGLAQALDATSPRIPVVSAWKFSPTSGLQGAPAKTDKGCSFVALLTPVVVGDPVKLSSETLSGTYKVQSRASKGDTHGTGAGSWVISCEAVSL
jgi:hypothetical protein